MTSTPLTPMVIVVKRGYEAPFGVVGKTGDRRNVLLYFGSLINSRRTSRLSLIPQRYFLFSALAANQLAPVWGRAALLSRRCRATESLRRKSQIALQGQPRRQASDTHQE